MSGSPETLRFTTNAIPDGHTLDETEVIAVSTVLSVCEAGYPRHGHARRGWTKDVIRALVDAGDRVGHLTYPHFLADGGRRDEWQYDACWWSIIPGANGPDCWMQVTDLALSVECEWNTDEASIADDLLKLVFCKASHRLFIYEATHKTEPERWMRSIKSMREPYCSGRFVLLSLPTDPDKDRLMLSWS
jgi:hypothetical protein